MRTRRNAHSGTEPRRRGLRRPGGRGLAGLLVTLIICLLLSGCGAGGSPSASLARVPASNRAVDPGSSLGGRPAPDFTLLDQFGRPVSLSQFRGKAVIVAFVDSRCTTVCPLTTVSMVEALHLLGPAARHVQLLGIDANPVATRVADVRAYSVAHDMMHSWLFLTGPLDKLKRVWKDYGVFVQAAAGNIDHEPAIFLIRPDGREQTLFLTQMSYAAVSQQAQVLADATAAVLPKHPAARHSVSLAARHGIPPTAPVTLSAVGGGQAGHGTVQLGRGHAHLVVFFASWLDETSDVTAQLSALNRYQAVAARRGWPSVVAIDAATTEPNPGALPRTLAQVRGGLHYPVVLDRTGTLADGYGAQQVPWITLVSATGRELFTSSGWFSSAARLEQAVARALGQRG